MSVEQLYKIISNCDIITIQSVPIGQIFRFKGLFCTRTGNSTFQYVKNNITINDCVGDYLDWLVAVPVKKNKPKLSARQAILCAGILGVV